MAAETTGAEAAGGDSETVDQRRPDREEVFDLLSNHRRRYAIHVCKDEDGPIEIGELAERVAAWEQETTVEELEWDDRKTVYTSLQQTHLPTLEEAGMVTYEDGTVELTDRAATLDVYLDIVPGDSIPWGVYYLGLSVVGLAVLIAVGLELIPTDPVPVVGWGVAIVLLFAISAAVHVYQSQRLHLGDLERPP